MSQNHYERIGREGALHAMGGRLGSIGQSFSHEASYGVCRFQKTVAAVLAVLSPLLVMRLEFLWIPGLLVAYVPAINHLLWDGDIGADIAKVVVGCSLLARLALLLVIEKVNIHFLRNLIDKVTNALSLDTMIVCMLLLFALVNVLSPVFAICALWHFFNAVSVPVCAAITMGWIVLVLIYCQLSRHLRFVARTKHRNSCVVVAADNIRRLLPILRHNFLIIAIATLLSIALGYLLFVAYLKIFEEDAVCNEDNRRLDGPWYVPHVPFMFSRHFDLVEELPDGRSRE